MHGLYIHIPFCRAKCGYCDFCSFAGMESIYTAYAGALVREMEWARALPIQTIYFGGGTPTVLPPSLLAQIVEAVHAHLDTSAVSEITLEANPGTVSHDLLTSLRAMGFTRLSLGVQSLDAAELALLGRIHSPAEAAEAAVAAHRAGLEHLNLDLIYGLPGQGTATWLASLDAALALRPDHLSLYALTLEEGTPLSRAVAEGRLPEPDPDLAADQYEAAEDRLAGRGWVHYEISNWAAGEAAECRHNLVYWHNEPYLGLGAGAHSWTGGRRRANVSSPEEYVARVESGADPTEQVEEIGADLEMGETMMVGLRLLQEGMPFARFRERFGIDLRSRFGGEIAELEERGLLECDQRGIRLSRRGRLLGNQVFMRFLPG